MVCWNSVAAATLSPRAVALREVGSGRCPRESGAWAEQRSLGDQVLLLRLPLHREPSWEGVVGV